MATDVRDEKGAVEVKRTLTLKSIDNQKFVVSESAAFLSETIKNMVEDFGASSVIPLPNVDGNTLAKVIDYLNKHDEGSSDAILDEEEKKKFDEEFVLGEEMDDLCSLAMAANYLNIKGMLDVVCKKIAGMVKGQSVSWVRETFGIENDYTPEEEEMVRQENAWAWQGVDPDDIN